MWNRFQFVPAFPQMKHHRLTDVFMRHKRTIDRTSDKFKLYDSIGFDDCGGDEYKWVITVNGDSYSIATQFSRIVKAAEREIDSLTSKMDLLINTRQSVINLELIIRKESSRITSLKAAETTLCLQKIKRGNASNKGKGKTYREPS